MSCELLLERLSEEVLRALERDSEFHSSPASTHASTTRSMKRRKTIYLVRPAFACRRRRWEALGPGARGGGRRLGSDPRYRFMRFSEELHDVAQFPSESRKDG